MPSGRASFLSHALAYGRAGAAALLIDASRTGALEKASVSSWGGRSAAISLQYIAILSRGVDVLCWGGTMVPGCRRIGGVADFLLQEPEAIGLRRGVRTSPAGDVILWDEQDR